MRCTRRQMAAASSLILPAPQPSLPLYGLLSSTKSDLADSRRNKKKKHGILIIFFPLVQSYLSDLVAFSIAKEKKKEKEGHTPTKGWNVTGVYGM